MESLRPSIGHYEDAGGAQNRSAGVGEEDQDLIARAARDRCGDEDGEAGSGASRKRGEGYRWPRSGHALTGGGIGLAEGDLNRQRGIRRQGQQRNQTEAQYKLRERAPLAAIGTLSRWAFLLGPSSLGRDEKMPDERTEVQGG
jgi:hypothetical protein